jgi:hypothetical protein
MTASATLLPFELELLPRSAPSASSSAVFLPGACPRIWLALLSPARGRLLSLELLIVPSSLSDLRAQGVLILGPPGLVRDLPGVPLRCLADRLYIPADTDLRVPCTEQELAAALPTSLCLLLPSCGFVGFEDRDRLKVTDLIGASSLRDARWSAAPEGLPDLPPPGPLRPLQPALSAPSIAAMLAAPGIASPPEKKRRSPKKGRGLDREGLRRA